VGSSDLATPGLLLWQLIPSNEVRLGRHNLQRLQSMRQATTTVIWAIVRSELTALFSQSSFVVMSTERLRILCLLIMLTCCTSDEGVSEKSFASMCTSHFIPDLFEAGPRRESPLITYALLQRYYKSLRAFGLHVVVPVIQRALHARRKD